MLCILLIIDNWVLYYIDCVQVVMDGIWISVNIWQGIGDGMVGVGEIFSVVLVEYKVEVEVLCDVIVVGEYYLFIGLINKQDGIFWLVEGEIVDDGVLVGMNFYIEGVEGDVLF